MERGWSWCPNCREGGKRFTNPPSVSWSCLIVFFVPLHIPRLRFSLLRTKILSGAAADGRTAGVELARHITPADDAMITTTAVAVPRPTWIGVDPKVERCTVHLLLGFLISSFVLTNWLRPGPA